MSKLFFSLLLLFCLLITLSLSKPCPPCGTTLVPYPLSTNPSCNDPSCPIRCALPSSGGTLFFDALNSLSYPITSISPSAQRLVIRPASFVAGTCVTTDIRSQGIQLNPSLPFNVSSSNTIMLLNCTQRLLLSALNCSSDSLCHVYINATRDAAACGQIPICYTFRAGGSSTSYSVRASEVGCSAYRNFVNLNPLQSAGNWGSSEGVELQGRHPESRFAGRKGTARTGSTPRVRLMLPVGPGSNVASALMASRWTRSMARVQRMLWRVDERRCTCYVSSLPLVERPCPQGQNLEK